MKINRLVLPLNKTVDLSDDIIFDNSIFDKNHIRGINDCHVLAKATQYEDVLRIEVNIKANVIGVCAYTLEDVLFPVNLNDELIFGSDENNENYYFEDKNVFEIDEYILALILSAVPSKIIKKGAKRPTNGDGYRVLSEEELAKERSANKDERWSKLDDLDL